MILIAQIAIGVFVGHLLLMIVDIILGSGDDPR